MGSFLTTRRMNPALANRVKESVRRGRSRTAGFDRTWTIVFRVGALVFIAIALISLSVLRKRENDQLEQARRSLIDAVSQKRAELTDEDMRTLDRAVTVLLRAPGPYEGDRLTSETRSPEAFSAVPERPILYVRGPTDAFENDDALRRGALLSALDAFVRCLAVPPRDRTEKALLGSMRSDSDSQSHVGHVRRLYDLLSGIPLLQPAWKGKV